MHRSGEREIGRGRKVEKIEKKSTGKRKDKKKPTNRNKDPAISVESFPFSPAPPPADEKGEEEEAEEVEEEEAEEMEEERVKKRNK